LPAGTIDIAQLNDGVAFASQVVAKGDGFLVQSVRFPLLNPLREMRLPNQPQVGQVLLHTKLPEGSGASCCARRLGARAWGAFATVASWAWRRMGTFVRGGLACEGARHLAGILVAAGETPEDQAAL